MQLNRQMTAHSWERNGIGADEMKAGGEGWLSALPWVGGEDGE